MEVKELADLLEKSKEALNEKIEGSEKTAKDTLAKVEKFLEDIEGKAGKEEIDEMQKQFDALSTKLKGIEQKGSGGGQIKSFESVIGESLDENKEVLSLMAKTKSKRESSIEMKAVGDMTFTNFGTGAYAAATTEVRQTLYQSPFSPLWLRNILPNASTSSNSIQYLRENGGEGAVATWDGTPDGGVVPDKPQVDHDFELITDTVDWLAGFTRIPRGMLDDVVWLRSYLSQQLIFGKRGLFVAENGLIITELDANSIAYDGARTILVEQMYDAAFGQLRDEYFRPTHILANHRDVVNEIMLNKSSGSGVYDLPVGTVLIVDGQLTLGGVPVIGVPNIEVGDFYVMDNTQTQFVSRMSPEVRFFEEDRDNVIKNLITVRVESRAAVLVFDQNAVIKGAVTT